MDSSTQTERIAAEWLARRDSGAWTGTDQAELDAWLAASTAHRVAWLRIKAAWERGDRLKALGAGLPAGQVPPRGAWTLSPFFRHPAEPALIEPGAVEPDAVEPDLPGEGSEFLPLSPACGGRDGTACAPSARVPSSARAAGAGRGAERGRGEGDHRSPSAPDALVGTEATPPVRPVDLRNYTFRKARKPSSRRPLRFGAAAAASLALAAATLMFGWRHFAPVEQTAYATTIGSVQTVQFPDGSQATLSSDSRIGMRLSRRQRHVELQQGEIFFDIARDPRRPFVVEAGARRVVVLGTRFSVRGEADALRVVVTEGRVQLEAEGAPSPVLLTAGMVAVADAGGVQVQAHPADRVAELLNWRDGYLSFRSTPLAEAAAEFNRYNAQKLVVDDPAIAAIPIGGNFRWSNTDAFVRLLEQGFGVRAERRGDEIVLSAQ